MRRPVRWLWVAGALALAVPAAQLADAVVAEPPAAHAALSVAYSLDELVHYSPEVAVVEATERQSVWEKIGGSKRIVTYTKLRRVEQVYGSTTPTLWVRTLGGAVDRIGQHVAGEAQFTLGKQSLVFLAKTDDGTYVVAGTAQGHYPIVDGAKTRKLGLSPNRGDIVKRKGSDKSIQEALEGVEVGRGITKVKDAKARVDANKKK